MTPRVDRFIDTNVLLAATTPARPEHARVLALLTAGFADGSLFLSGQVLREYLSVATRRVTAGVPPVHGAGSRRGVPEAPGASRTRLPIS